MGKGNKGSSTVGVDQNDIRRQQKQKQRGRMGGGQSKGEAFSMQDAVKDARAYQDYKARKEALKQQEIERRKAEVEYQQKTKEQDFQEHLDSLIQEMLKRGVLRLDLEVIENRKYVRGIKDFVVEYNRIPENFSMKLRWQHCDGLLLVAVSK